MSQTFLSQILKQKEQEVALMAREVIQEKRVCRSFYQHLKSEPGYLHIIAEVKKASPSLGTINLDEDIISRAKIYQEAGASMVSVLTDQTYFKGSMADLESISRELTIPSLNKDFIIDEKQIIRACNAGATVILLIVAALSPERLEELYEFALSLSLEVLVEVHNLEELERAHTLGAKIIGVNNRDLTTFKTDLQTSFELAPYFQEKPVYISESAIYSQEDAALLAPYFNGILVGTALMQAPDIAEKVKELQIDKG